MILFKIVLPSLLVLLLVGCSSTPQETVEGMYSALKDGDMLKLNRNVTEPKAKQLSLKALKECSVSKNAYVDDFRLIKDCFREMYSETNVKNIIITTVSHNQSYATVTLESKSDVVTTRENLIKVDGKWKVAFIK